MRWTSFISLLKDLHGKEFVVTIATGHTHTSRVSATRKPDGYVHMIGKISNDIEQNLDSNAGSISLTFVGAENSVFDQTNLVTAPLVFTEVTDKRGGTGKDKTGIKPAAITTEIATELIAGEVSLVLQA